MMGEKSKLFAIVVFFLVCIWLLPIITNPFSYTGLNWLSLDTMIVAQYGYGDGYGKGEEDDDTPPPPPRDVDPSGRDDAYDPETFTEECNCSLNIHFDFPPGAVSVPVEVRAYHTGLPEDVPAPADGIIGCPFFFGAWIRGEGKVVEEFNESVVIKVSYNESDFAQLPGRLQPIGFAQSDLGLLTGSPLAFLTYPAMGIFASNEMNISPAQADKVHLSMYDPTTETWVKLCSRTDGNQVSGAILVPTPLEKGGNALYAVTIDNAPALDQVVDDQGKTTLSIPGSNFQLGVLPGTVEVGTHFTMTPSPNAPDSPSLKLLPTPFDVKACQADYTTANKISQVTKFAKPLELTFGVNANTLARVGGKANITIVHLQNRQWVDFEELGNQVIRDNNTITVKSNQLGTFSMATQ